MSDYFDYPGDDVIDGWNNKEAWKQQIEDWAEQNREYYTIATHLRELLRRVLYLHSDFQSVPSGKLEKLLKDIEEELADD